MSLEAIDAVAPKNESLTADIEESYDDVDETRDSSSDEEEEDEEEEQPPLFKLSKINIPDTKRFNQLIHPKDNICLVCDDIIDETIIVLGTELGYIYIINIETISVIKRLKLHRDYIMCIDTNQRGWIMSCCIEGNVSIFDYRPFLEHKNKTDFDNELLNIKRVNFNKSLNFVKIHPNFNNKNNKCFFISSFNGSLLAVNLQTLTAKEEDSEVLAETNADFTSNWLSYIPSFSAKGKNTNEQDLQKKFAFDIKITNLIDLDSITFLEVLRDDKLLFLDFNNLYIMDLKSSTYELILKSNINLQSGSNGDDIPTHSFSFKKTHFLFINKLLLLIDTEQFLLLKVINLDEYLNEKTISISLFNFWPLDIEKLIDPTYNLVFPPISILTQNRNTKELNFKIISIDDNFSVSVHEDINLPIGNTSSPFNVIFSPSKSQPKLIALFNSLIIKIIPLQRGDIFKWYLDHAQLFKAWEICGDDKEKLAIGFDIVKRDITYLSQVFTIQNYTSNEISMETLITAYDENIVDYYCYNQIKGYKTLLDQLLTFNASAYNDALFFNNKSLTKILKKITEMRDFVILEEILIKWERQLNFSQFDYNSLIKILDKDHPNSSVDFELLNCLNICFYRANQFDGCFRTLYKLLYACDDPIKADVYKHKLFDIIQMSPKILTTITSDGKNLNEFLSKINNPALKSINDFKTHFSSFINLILNNMSVSEIISLSDMIQDTQFPEFKFLLLAKAYSIIPSKNIKQVTLSLVKLYLNNPILSEYQPNLVQFLIKNSTNYDPTEILDLIFQKNNESEDMQHKEELIFLYSLLKNYKSALELILETGLKNPIDYIMTSEATINDINLWKQILLYSNENKNLLTAEIIRTININEQLGMETIIFIYEQLLDDVICQEKIFQNGFKTTARNVELKKLEYLKLKHLLTTELENLFSRRMKKLNYGKYYNLE